METDKITLQLIISSIDEIKKEVAAINLTIDTQFEAIKRGNRNVLTYVLGVLSFIVLSNVSITLYLLGSQKESAKDRSELNTGLKDLRYDFGTVLHILPADTKKGYEYFYEEKIQKYNPKRGDTFQKLQKPEIEEIQKTATNKIK